MANKLLAALMFLSVIGCTGPEVHLAQRNEVEKNGVRVSKVIPYEIFIYSTDANGQLHLQQHLFEYLPDPSNVYVVNYQGAFIYSSKLEVELHEHTGLKRVHLETSRTFKEGAAAAGEIYKGYPRKEEKEEEPEPEISTVVQEIKTYRETYKDAVNLPPAPGEPSLPDGSILPSTQ